jgi:hypothetical protein
MNAKEVATKIILGALLVISFPVWGILWILYVLADIVFYGRYK